MADAREEETNERVFNHSALKLMIISTRGSKHNACMDENSIRKALVAISWCYSVVAPGDAIHVIGEFDSEGKCEINRGKNFLIVHPDILVSGTRVAGSFSCSRRTVLDERLKSSEYSAAALIGTLLHQMFQAGLIRESPTKEFLEDYARVVLQKSLESI